MITHVQITDGSYRRCFTERMIVELKPGLNLLVGDQGCGKSTLLSLIKGHCSESRFDREEADEHFKMYGKGGLTVGSFDAEKDNFRTKSWIDNNFGMFQLQSMRMSHGESSLAWFEYMSKAEKEGVPLSDVTLLLDEPETALSLRSVYKLADILKRSAEEGRQLLVATHHPVLIQSVPEVFSLEHWKWMSPEKFLKAMKGPVCKGFEKRCKAWDKKHTEKKRKTFGGKKHGKA